jgi:pyruvate/2-oxoglutarate dehydrogenase complex dihydrolipoamide dehydrogenase (E3) component
VSRAGRGVSPIRLRTVAATVFTRPEIAAVGVPQTAIDDGSVRARTVQNRITVDDLAQTLAIYPSLSGSITEAARRLIGHDGLD